MKLAYQKDKSQEGCVNMEPITIYNYKKLSNIQKYYLIVNAAKIVQKRFDYLLEQKSGLHCHHIKPKSLYPDLIDDKENLIKVPAIVHWTLHKILLEYYKEINNEVAIKKMSYVNLEDFINKFYENRKKKLNFKEFEVEFINDDICHNFLISVVLDCSVKIIYNEIDLLVPEIKYKLIQEKFNLKKLQSKFTDEYEQYKQNGKYYKEYLRELNIARNNLSVAKEDFRDWIKNNYLDLTEDLLDMYCEDIKDELDDCYKDFDDLYNTLESIKEEFTLELSMSDEELREALKEL